jgi:hypothetical protein
MAATTTRSDLGACTHCGEVVEPAFDVATVEPQLPAPYAPVYCRDCRQVNRATGALIGLERRLVHCALAGCTAMLPRAEMHQEPMTVRTSPTAFYYLCPDHAPTPTYTPEPEQRGTATIATRYYATPDPDDLGNALVSMRVLVYDKRTNALVCRAWHTICGYVHWDVLGGPPANLGMMQTSSEALALWCPCNDCTAKRAPSDEEERIAANAAAASFA